MRIERVLQVSEQEFYDYLETTLIEDVRNATGTVISSSHIKKGLTYAKALSGSESKVEVTLLDYERGKSYVARVKTDFDEVVIDYRTRMVEKGLEVVFREEIGSFRTKNALFRKFGEVIYLSRMCDALYNIQNHIQNSEILSVDKAVPSGPDYYLLKKVLKKRMMSKDVSRSN